MTTKVFDALLWDMRPMARNVRQTREEQNRVIFGLIESIYSGSVERNEAQQLQMMAKIAWDSVQRNTYQVRYQLQVREKPERHGLHRIGAIHDLDDRTPVGLSDFYYSGGQPMSADDFMLCTDDAVPDDPRPGRSENPGCEHWFALPELSATVKVDYRRRHLGEWREIKRRVAGLLLSWVPPEAVRR